MLRFKGLSFDDYSTDEYGTYSRICKGCIEKYKDIISTNMLDNMIGVGVCGVCGCTVSDWEDENAEVTYIDFKDGEYEIIKE